MLTWNSLTKSQKRWVENVAKILPDCVTNGHITATQCYDSFKLLEKQRVKTIENASVNYFCILAKK